MRFKLLTDEQWEYIEPLLPPSEKEGKPRADDRQTIDAIVYALKTGIPGTTSQKNTGTTPRRTGG